MYICMYETVYSEYETVYSEYETVYSETSLIRRPLGLENKIRLGGCQIREVICVEKVHVCASIWCQFERMSN